jgi:hypothetical protein
MVHRFYTGNMGIKHKLFSIKLSKLEFNYQDSCRHNHKPFVLRFRAGARTDA